MMSKESPETRYLHKRNNVRKMSGGRSIAEMCSGYGVTHVFFVEAILRQTLMEMETLGIRRVLTHSEKAAAYMADGYARTSCRPGICMAQSVGAANLAAGLQDAYLALSPVIAITGRQQPISQYRNTYQEILHYPLFEPVTKYNVNVDTIEQLPYLLRQAFREATSGSPRPVHLDLMGNIGQVIDFAEANMEVIVEEPSTQSLALELAPYHINVNAICPNLVETERVDQMAAALRTEDMSAEEYREKMIERVNSTTPLGRIGYTSDVAKVAAFLASSESDYLTGLSISVSGGSHMG